MWRVLERVVDWFKMAFFHRSYLASDRQHGIAEAIYLDQGF
jgi:hypothetical protein